MKIRYKDENMMGMDLLIATYKGVRMSLGQGEDWISIYSCDSKNEGKGEVQEMIKLLKEDFPKKRLCGSVPLHPAMKHIYEKFNIDYGDN